MNTNTIEDKFILGGHEFTSRFILGSGKFSLELVKACIEKAGTQIVTLALRRANVLCLAATHDTELTYLLEDLYTNYHFEEQITAQSISFPYRLEQGPARGKNAIALLGNMGIDEKIVKQAERRAAEFETTGSWEKNKFLR